MHIAAQHPFPEPTWKTVSSQRRPPPRNPACFQSPKGFASVPRSLYHPVTAETADGSEHPRSGEGEACSRSTVGWEQRQTTASLSSPLVGGSRGPSSQPHRHQEPPPNPHLSVRSRAWLTFDITAVRKKEQHRSDVWGCLCMGRGWCPDRPPGWRGGASAGARGDIRTAGRASRAGSGLAQGQRQGVGGAALTLCS